MNQIWKYPHKAIPSAWSRLVKRYQGRHSLDALTGLANDRTFFELTEAEIERARRYHRPFTLAYLSVDNFQTIVQRSGADRGRTVLRTVAEVLTSNLRGVDTVARLREAEFAILLPETEGEPARIVLRRILEYLDTAITQEERSVTVSTGAVTWIRADLTLNQLLQKAYQSMYAARHDGLADFVHEVLDVTGPGR